VRTPLGALSYLAWRALGAHPWKRSVTGGTGRDRFLAAYGSEGLDPTTAEDHAAAEAASACISCGLCEAGCPLAGVAPSIRDLGLHAAFRLYAKGAPELRHAAEALDACAGCAGCEPLCPTGVPISRLVRYFQGRAAERRRREPAGPEGHGRAT
jgi:heterodisulfide reductase subunit C